MERDKLSKLTAETLYFDSAEGPAGTWEATGFVTSETRAHSGSRSYYSGSGENLNNILRLASSLEIQGIERIRFWSYYSSAASYDYLYLETSEDGQSWTKILSLSGQKNLLG